MTIDFYYAPFSSASRIHWALEELGVPYTKHKLDLQAGDQKKPEYLAINPNGKVPCIVEDGAAVFESLAILVHLGERHGVEKHLWPAPGTPDHAAALSWLTWGTVTFATTMFRWMMNTSERFPAEQRNAAQAEGARRELNALLGLLEARLDGREFLVGNHFSLVDLAIAATVAFGRRIALDFSDFPRVTAWTAHCTNRPAFRVSST